MDKKYIFKVNDDEEPKPALVPMKEKKARETARELSIYLGCKITLLDPDGVEPRVLGVYNKGNKL